MTSPEPPGLDYDRPGGALRWVLAELARRGHKPMPFGPGALEKVVSFSNKAAPKQGTLGLDSGRAAK